MSETDRMKAERAAKIALEEERIRAEREKESGGDNSYNKIVFTFDAKYCIIV